MSEKVTLQVYDLSRGMAKTMGPMFGLQIDALYHTSLVVYGLEYYFGGGICSDHPGTTAYGQAIKSVALGNTQVPQELFLQFLSDLSARFSAEKYNLIENNCNHFTNQVAQFLLGHGIDPEIVNQGKNLLNTPIGKQFAPLLQSMHP